MALIFAESFDSGAPLNTAAYSGKWHPNASFPNAGYLTTGRNGNGWAINSTTGQATQLSHYLQPSEQDDLIVVGMARKMGYIGQTSTFNYPWLVLLNDATATGSGNIQLYFYWNNQTAKIDVYRGPQVTLLGSSSVLPGNVWIYLEFKVRLSASAGTIEIRQNGTSIFTFGGVTKYSGTANVFSLVTFGNGYYSGFGASESIVDDLYICNEQGATNNDFLGDVRVEALLPNADGSHSDLVPYNYNRLPNVNVSGAETDATGWVADTNCSIARVTTPVHTGLGSTGALRVTATGSGNVLVKTATGTGGAPVRSGQSYYGAAYGTTAVTGRNYEIGIEWYDVTGSLLSRSTLYGTSIDTTSYVQKAMSSSAVAPSNAAFASLIVQIDGCAASEIHYLDDAYISEGAVLADPGANPSTNHYLAVNDPTVYGISSVGSDESYLIGATNDNVDTWNFTDPTSPPSKAVKGVVVFATARTDTLSGKSLALVARDAAGTESTSGDVPLSQTWGTQQAPSAGFDLDPNGSAWTISAVAGSQFGVKVRP